MTNKIYKNLVLPVISGILAITTGCSNIPVANSFTNTNYVNTAQSLSLSSSDNDLNKIFNYEYKRFSTKNADNNKESIAISKRYVLSTNQNNTYTSSDNDSGGQPPNRIKITADIKKTNITNSGINFVIDGVTTFSAPGTSGPFANGMGTVIDYNTNYFRYEFIWDGKYTDGKIVEDGIYSVHALNNTSGIKTLGLDIPIQVTSEPLTAANMEFYDPDELTNLSSLSKALYAPEIESSKLYDITQKIKIVQEKISNLQSRNNPDTTKISTLQSELSSLQSQKQSQQSSVDSIITNLISKKNEIKNLINDITNNSNFAKDYALANKPTDTSDYSEAMFHAGLNFENNIDSTASIYGSDDQTIPSLVTSFEKSKAYTEKVDVLPVLKASTALITEINLLNDLNDDSKGNLLTNGFYESEFLISILSKNINKHKQFLDTYSKKVAKDLNNQYQGLTKILLELHNSVELPISLVMKDEPTLKNNPFVIQGLKPINSENFSIKFFLQRLANVNALVNLFLGYDATSPIKQKVIMYISNISQPQWDALPQTDKDLLINNFDYILELLDDLASTFTGAILADLTEEALTNKKTINLAKEEVNKIKSVLTSQNIEGILEIVYQLSKAALNIAANKNSSYQNDIKNINNSTRKDIAEFKKRVTYLPIVCETDSGVYSIAGFSTLAKKDKCVYETTQGSQQNKLTAVSEQITRAKSGGTLFKWYVANNGKVPQQQVLGYSNYLGTSTLPNTVAGNPVNQDLEARKYLMRLKNVPQPLQYQHQINVYNKIEDLLINVLPVKEIPIRKIITKANNSSDAIEMYFPDFSDYAFATVKFSDTNQFMTGLTSEDDKVGFNLLGLTELYQKGFITTNPFSNIEQAKIEAKNIKKLFGFQWHHNEDLDTYQFIPGIFHFGARHDGANSIISQFSDTIPISRANRDVWRDFLNFPALQ